VYTIFNDEILEDFIYPEYLKFKSKSSVKKWVDLNAESKCEVWYTINTKGKYIGYICCKAKESFCEVCELSIVLIKGYRGFETGYQITKTLIDYLVSKKYFKYIIAYSNKKNRLTDKLLRKLGFKKTNKLHEKITKRLYSEKSSLNIILNNNLFSISIK